MRVVTHPGLRNARHLGGIPAGEGVTQLQNVIRSGFLEAVAQVGLAVQALGVETVVDLRTAEERERSPEPDFSAIGLRGAWLPLVVQDPSPLGVHLEHGHVGFRWLYQNYLEHGRSSLAGLVELAASGAGLLYHCAAGEDRTGLVSAVLLSLAGVSDDEIIKDHSLSLDEQRLSSRGYIGPAAQHRATAPLLAMRETLEMVRQRWGGFDGYLTDAGVPGVVIERFRLRAAGAPR